MRSPGKSALLVPNEGGGEQGKDICEAAGIPLQRQLPLGLSAARSVP